MDQGTTDYGGPGMGGKKKFGGHDREKESTRKTKMWRDAKRVDLAGRPDRKWGCWNTMSMVGHKKKGRKGDSCYRKEKTRLNCVGQFKEVGNQRQGGGLAQFEKPAPQIDHVGVGRGGVKRGPKSS